MVQLSPCTVSELQICNAAITIANIEGGKIACVNTHNRKLLDFPRSSHNYAHA